MADRSRGKSAAPVVFQKPQPTASGPQEAAFLTGQVELIKSVLAKAKEGGRPVDRRLKSQAIEKVNLLKAGIDYANGKRAYLPIPRLQLTPLPKTAAAFLLYLDAAVADIPAMFLRANVPMEDN